ncbi:membrane protein insertion efficiency factor YidD [Guyparkeria sp. SB14A]|uniref:membrane protein insertion efficiency factor YidD n=1 Tax=Guyparkeria TaxID=2035712 RepID=UPI0010AB8964|nr:membrane protein insertion efficiency factor YidD [Guyparkeria sp. SB14A]
MRRVLIGLVKGYRLLISPMLPPSCRFYPTCSEYAVEALSRHGALKGGWLTLRRLGRCHPFCAGGIDPVPGTSSEPGGCPHDAESSASRADAHHGPHAVQSRD